MKLVNLDGKLTNLLSEKEWNNIANKTLKRHYFERLCQFNELKDENSAVELMVEVQEFLIKRGVLNDELQFVTGCKITDKEVKKIKDIFINVRREYQSDEEPCEDFSYFAVAIDWLLANNITPKIGR